MKDSRHVKTPNLNNDNTSAIFDASYIKWFKREKINFFPRNSNFSPFLGQNCWQSNWSRNQNTYFGGSLTGAPRDRQRRRPSKLQTIGNATVWNVERAKRDYWLGHPMLQHRRWPTTPCGKTYTVQFNSLVFSMSSVIFSKLIAREFVPTTQMQIFLIGMSSTRKRKKKFRWIRGFGNVYVSPANDKESETHGTELTTSHSW